MSMVIIVVCVPKKFCKRADSSSTYRRRRGHMIFGTQCIRMNQLRTVHNKFVA